MFEGFYKILNYIYLIDYAFSNLPALPFGRQAAGKCVIWVKIVTKLSFFTLYYQQISI